MTRIVHTSLGFTPLAGKQAISQAQRFKEQIRSVREKPPSVSLMTVTHADPPHMEVVAWYDRDDALAVEWIGWAEKKKDELWETLAERRKGMRW
jgi:hypothetical protein